MHHLLRPLRNQAPIPVIALKALPVKRSSETPFLATCPCSWRYCYEGFGDCAIRFLHGVSKMEMRSHGFVMANQIDLKSLDEQLERHLNRAWTMEIGEEQEEADAGLFTISVFLSLFFGVEGSGAASGDSGPLGRESRVPGVESRLLVDVVLSVGVAEASSGDSGLFVE
nr:serine/threonine-protein kinase STY13-like [Ipomoea batatas]